MRLTFGLKKAKYIYSFFENTPEGKKKDDLSFIFILNTKEKRAPDSDFPLTKWQIKKGAVIFF